MTIHQAYFGDDGGSHNLLATSIEHRKLIGRLKLITDAPASIDVPYPFLSGSLIENYYVFTQTMADPMAKRPGMFFSHCLLIPLEALGQFNNLKLLFGLFLSSPAREKKSIPSLVVNETTSPVMIKPMMAEAVLQSLLANKNTSVYIGFQGFEDALAYLWPRLTREIKENFSFTIAGTPNEIADAQYTLIYTPEEHTQRWTKFPIVSVSPTFEKSKAFSLIDDPAASDSIALRDFIQTHQIQIKSLYQLREVEKLYDLVITANENQDLVRLKRVITALTHWMPTPSAGTETKANALTYFLHRLRTADSQGFKLLRNMSFTAFEEGLIQVTATSQEWIKKYIQQRDDEAVKGIVDLIKEGLFGEAPSWWNDIVIENVQHAFQKSTSHTAEWIWKIWEADVRLVKPTSAWLTDKSELALIKTLRKEISKDILQNVSEVAKERQWFGLHAVSVANYLDTKEALEVQLAADATSELKHHIQLMLSYIPIKEFILGSAEINSSILHETAGELCVRDPHQLKMVDINEPNWQAIWYYAYQISGKLTEEIIDPQLKLYHLFDQLLEGKPVHQKLLEALIKLEYPVFTYPKRKALWAVIGEKNRTNLLENVSKYVIENLTEIEWLTMEEEVTQNIKSPDFINRIVIPYGKLQLSTKINLLEQLGVLNEQIMLNLLRHDQLQPTTVDEERVVQLLKKNRWKSVLFFLFNRRNASAFCQSIVHQCRDLYSFWYRRAIKKNESVRIEEVLDSVDQGRFNNVFSTLDRLEIKDWQYDRLRAEFVAGLKGIDLLDFRDRLKTFVRNLDQS